MRDLRNGGATYVQTLKMRGSFSDISTDSAAVVAAVRLTFLQHDNCDISNTGLGGRGR